MFVLKILATVMDAVLIFIILASANSQQNHNKESQTGMAILMISYLASAVLMWF